MWWLALACAEKEEPVLAEADDPGGDGSTTPADCLEPIRLFEDGDGDGYGADGRELWACEPQPGWVPQAGDCDDADPVTWPEAGERCDGLDNDCDPETPDMAEIGGVGFRSLQAALEAAGDGDTIVVCAGTHLERGLSIDREVTLVGETAEPADTVLDAQGQGVLLSAETDALTLRGLTLRGASDETLGSSWGAAVRASGALSVADCRVEDNRSATGIGGISAESLTVSGSVFQGNSSGTIHAAIRAGSLDISDSTFEDNEGGKAAVAGDGWVRVRDSAFLGNLGGGLHATAWELTLSGVTFEGNEGYDGGALLLHSQSPAAVTVTDTSFVGNTASDGGGAVYWVCGPDDTWTGGTFQGNTGRTGGAMTLYGGAYAPTQPITLREVVMEGNVADEGGGGLGLEIWSDDTLVQVEDSRIVGNTAEWGGGAGDAYSGSYGRLVLQDVTLERNVAHEGGGLSLDDMEAVLRSCDLGSEATDNTPDDLRLGGESHAGYGEDTSLECMSEGCL